MGHWACMCQSDDDQAMKRQRSGSDKSLVLKDKLLAAESPGGAQVHTAVCLLTIRRLRCYIKIKTVSSMVL